MNVQFPILLTLSKGSENAGQGLVLATYNQGDEFGRDSVVKIRPIGISGDKLAVDCRINPRGGVGSILFFEEGAYYLKSARKKTVRLSNTLGHFPKLLDGAEHILSIHHEENGQSSLVLHDARAQKGTRVKSFGASSIADFQIGRAGGSLSGVTPVVVALRDSTATNVVSKLVSFDLATGESRLIKSDFNTRITRFALSPLGDAIAYSDEANGQVYYQHLRSPSRQQLSIPQLEEETEEGSRRASVSFSPDGSRVLYSTYTHRLDWMRRDKLALASLYAAPIEGGQLQQLLGEYDGLCVENAFPAGLCRPISEKAFFGNRRRHLSLVAC